jgi:hypothetical protein
MRDLEARDFEAAAAFNARAEREDWQQHCDPTLAIRYPEMSAVLELWKGQARGRAMPARSDMSARVLKNYLSRIAIEERVQTNPSRYRWRLIGTQIVQILGERTGKLFDEDAPPKQAARWTASCDLLFEIERPVRFVGRVIVNNKDYLFSDLLFMPLADNTGAPRFVMGFGCYSAQKPLEPRPRDLLLGAMPG